MADEELVALLLDIQARGEEKLGAISAELDTMNGKLGGVASASDKAASEVESSGSRMGNALKTAGDKLGNWGVPFTGALTHAGDKMNETASKGTSAFQKLSNVGAVASVGVAAAAGVIAAESVHAAMSYQTVTTNIAAWGSISTAQATKITNAFTNTAGTTIYGAQQIGSAYGNVVGQLTAVAGHTLNASQAMTVMKASMNLAEGSGESLNSATSSLSGTMQAYHLKVGQAAQTSDQLFTIAKNSGTSLSQVSQSVGMVHNQLGALTPSLGQTGGFLIDMAEHGMKGSRALRVVATAMNHMLKPTEDMIKAQKNAKLAFDDLPASLQPLAKQYATGTMTAAQVTAATKNLGTANLQLFNQFKTSQDSIEKAQFAYQQLGISTVNAQGHFIGLGPVIDQLGKKLQGMTQAQQLSTLSQVFGQTAAAKLLPVVAAGSAAFDKAAGSVMKHGAAQKAAEKQSQTLQHQMEELKSTVDDFSIKLGQVLIPKLRALAHVMVEVIQWFMKHKDIALALAGVIGGVLALAVTAFAVNMGVKLVKSIGDAGKAIGSLGSKITSMIGKLFAGSEATEGMGVAAEGAGTEAEAAGVGFDSMLGPIGLVIAAGVLLITHWKLVEKIAKEVWSEVKKAFDVFMQYVKKWGPLVAEIILAPFTGGMSLILPMIIKHWNDIQRFFVSIPSKILSALGSGEQLLKKWGTDLLHGALDGVEAYAHLLFDFYVKLPLKILSYVGQGAKVLLHWGEELIEGIIHGIEHGVGKLVGIVKGLPGKVLGGLGHIGGSLVGGVASLFASGGLVNSPTLSMIGEKGPELVLPLTDPSRMQQLLNLAAPYLPPQPGGAGGGVSASGLGVPQSQQTIYAIESLVVVAQNPPQLAQQLAQQSRISALSSKPSGSTNLGVAV